MSKSQYKPAPMDYDGDGRSDEVFFRASTGEFFQLRSDSFGVSIRWVAGDGYQPIHADWDADGITDLGVVFDWYGSLAWYRHFSATGEVDGVIWGLSSDTPVPADYDGDGRDEIAVFRDGQWIILEQNGSGTIRGWGIAGDIPVAKDYDGDQVVDLAVYRPLDGTWWILSSAFQEGQFPEPLLFAQWGLPGDVPVPGKWFREDVHDIAVWRPSDGKLVFARFRRRDD